MWHVSLYLDLSNTKTICIKTQKAEFQNSALIIKDHSYTLCQATRDVSEGHVFYLQRPILSVRIEKDCDAKAYPSDDSSKLTLAKSMAASDFICEQNFDNQVEMFKELYPRSLDQIASSDFLQVYNDQILDNLSDPDKLRLTLNTFKFMKNSFIKKGFVLLFKEISFINHSCDANCDADICIEEGKEMKNIAHRVPTEEDILSSNMWMSIAAKRPIKKGEEITINYSSNSLNLEKILGGKCKCLKCSNK